MRRIPGTHIDQNCNAGVPYDEYLREKARNGDAPLLGNPYNTPAQEREAEKREAEECRQREEESKFEFFTWQSGRRPPARGR